MVLLGCRLISGLFLGEMRKRFLPRQVSNNSLSSLLALGILQHVGDKITMASLCKTAKCLFLNAVDLQLPTCKVTFTILFRKYWRWCSRSKQGERCLRLVATQERDFSSFFSFSQCKRHAVFLFNVLVFCFASELSPWGRGAKPARRREEELRGGSSWARVKWMCPPPAGD